MNDLEDRLTDLLTRSAAAVEVEVDLSRITDAPPGRRRRSRSPYLIGVAAAGVAIALAVAQLGPGDAEPTRTTGPPPPPAEVPRYVAPSENWHLLQHGNNQQTYTTEAGRRMTLTWYPGDEWDERLAHWGVREDEDKRLVGDRYRVVSEARQVALWRNRGYVFEVRGTEHVLETIDLEEVDEETWRKTLPRDALPPSVQEPLIAATILDYSLPESYTEADLAPAAEARGTREAILLEVADTVVCHWVDVWRAGDIEARAGAVAELLTYESWPIPEAARVGEWGAVLLQQTDIMRFGETLPDAAKVELDLRVFGCPQD